MRRRDLENAFLERQLQDELRGVRPPDVRQRVLAAGKERRKAALAAAQAAARAQPARRRVLTASRDTGDAQQTRPPFAGSGGPPIFDTAGRSTMGSHLAATAAIVLAASVSVTVAVMQNRSEHGGVDPNEAAVLDGDRKPTQDPKQERLRRAKAQRKARRWVTFLELDNRRVEAVNALLKLGADAAPALLQALEHPRPAVVRSAAHILRVLGSQAAAAKKKLTVLSTSKDPKVAEAARYALAGILPAGITGVTLVVAWGANEVQELDKTGKVVRRLSGLRHPWDAERLPNGNYLICCFSGRKVVEMTAKGKVVWSFEKVTNPMSAQRLPNGNTLIVDANGASGVLEINRAGKTVWKYGGSHSDAERLLNGNTLIADMNGRVIEVSSAGKIVWQYAHGQQSLSDADRLPNGNTLITLPELGKVIEVTPEGGVAHEMKGLDKPKDADRLSNGHTLVAQRDGVAEFDVNGKKIWSAKVKSPGKVHRY